MKNNYEHVKLWRKRHPDKYKESERIRNQAPKRKKSRYRRNNAQQKRYYEESKKFATCFGKGNGRAWTIHEDFLVLDYQKTARELALQLGRTFWSIVNRRQVLK